MKNGGKPTNPGGLTPSPAPFDELSLEVSERIKRLTAFEFSDLLTHAHKKDTHPLMRSRHTSHKRLFAGRSSNYVLPRWFEQRRGRGRNGNVF